MARKKQEIALQQEIETQEEWEELLTKEGLIGMMIQANPLITPSAVCTIF